MRTKDELINFLINIYKFESYLEIGVFKKGNFNLINCKNKICVDPDKKMNADYIMTSDEFFRSNVKKFDVIFVDGLHHREQVYKDVINSLSVLNENGIILCHDMLPVTKLEQQVPVTSENINSWTGDCWKAWFQILMLDGLETFIVDIDHGIGVIKKDLEKKSIINWEFFLRFKNEMNIICIDDFLKIYE